MATVVPDYEAIAACQSNADIQINGIKRSIYECKLQIQSYEKLKTEIGEKKAKLADINASLNDCQYYLDDAHINFKMMDDQSYSCITGIEESLNSMLTTVESDLKEWELKKERFEDDLLVAQNQRTECSSLVKTIESGEASSETN